MTNRFLLNYPQEERISIQLLDFFWSELTYARSIKDHELWIVSPWITENNFDVSSRGSFNDLWPGFTKSSIPLSYILKKFVDYQSTINIICRPPHLLVPAENFLVFYELRERLTHIDSLFEELGRLQGQVKYISSNQKKLGADVHDVTAELQKHVRELRIFLDIFRRASIGQSNVVSFVQDIYNYAPDKVNVYYNYKLHAKILVGKLGGFIGSANVTYSGFNFNDELLLYITDEETLNALRTIVARFAQSEGDWWKRKADDYSVLYEYKKQLGDDTVLREMAKSKGLPDEIREVLELLGIST